MSWQAYVDTNILGEGTVSQAAILGLAGGVWAKSEGFQLSSDEQKAIISAFNNPDGVLASGLRIANEKYFGVRTEDRSIYLKKGGDGAVLVKTTQAVLLGIYKAPLQASPATVTVEKLGDYLVNAGF
jgi:profilin